MRLSIVSLITRKETTDLLRDRRTVALIFLAPLVLYPLFGLTAWVFASELVGTPTVIGVVNKADAEMSEAALPFPKLFVGDRFSPELLKKNAESSSKNLESSPVILELDDDPAEAIRSRKVQAVMVVPKGFATDLEQGKRPTITFLNREGDEKSKLAIKKLGDLVEAWEKLARVVRFQRDGKPADYDQLITIEDPTRKPFEERTATEIRDLFARVFPLILVLWVVAGAIQPAVDLTAGEKERGTMETLLISPAERSEIVVGKFLAVTFFGFSSVVWNVIALTVSAVVGQSFLGLPIVNLPGMVGCVILGVPIAMLFSAISLALGVFARSTKEGQYYLIPLMLMSMPLAFLSIMPTTELNPFTALIPVTGPLLLQQKLLAVTGDPIPWGYFAPVLIVQLVYVAVALLLAWWQFCREGVLFRETGSGESAGLRGLFGRPK
jgi:sodium transport system permease protein